MNAVALVCPLVFVVLPLKLPKDFDGALGGNFFETPRSVPRLSSTRDPWSASNHGRTTHDETDPLHPGRRRGTHDEWDSKLVASLTRELGQGYDIRYPRMPNEADPSYPAWKTALEQEIAALDDAAILVGHSVGGTILINALAEHAPDRKLAGIFLISAPFVGPADGRLKISSRSRIWVHVCRELRLSISIMAAKMTLPPSRTSISTSRPFHRRMCASSRGATTSSMTIFPRSRRTSDALSEPPGRSSLRAGSSSCRAGEPGDRRIRSPERDGVNAGRRRPPRVLPECPWRPEMAVMQTRSQGPSPKRISS